MKLRGFIIDDFFDEQTDDQDPVALQDFYDKIDILENRLGNECFIGQDDGKFFVAVKPMDEGLLKGMFSYPVIDIDKEEWPWDNGGY